MAGLGSGDPLGLINAVSQYQQGKAWAQGQQEYARAQKQRADIDAANAEATGVINASKAEWAANGAQGQYRPNDMTMFKAAEARGMALAKRGLWDQYLQNDAQVAPMRIKARATALQRFESDGDGDAFVRATYPSLFDGKEIVGTEKIEGAEAVPGTGLKARPSGLKLTLSDKTEKVVYPQEIAEMVKLSLIDRVATAKREVEINFERAKAMAKSDADSRTEEVKAAHQRELEDRKARNLRGLKDVEFGGQKVLRGMEIDSRERVGLRGNETSLKVGAGHDAASRYGADRRLEGSKLGLDSKEGGAGKKDALFDQLHDEAVRVYGDEQIGALGGTKTANENTQAIAAYAAALKKSDPGLSVPEALRKSTAEWKKSAGGKAWLTKNQSNRALIGG